MRSRSATPENAAGQVAVGVSRLAAGQFEEAIQSFDRAQLLDATQTNALVGRGARAGASGRIGRRRVRPPPCWPTAPTRHEVVRWLLAAAVSPWYDGLERRCLDLGRAGAARVYQPGARSATAKMALAEVLLARGQNCARRSAGTAGAGRCEGLQRGTRRPRPGCRHAGRGRPADAEQALAALGARAEPLAPGSGRAPAGLCAWPGRVGPGGIRIARSQGARNGSGAAEGEGRSISWRGILTSPFLYTLGEAYLAAGRSDDATTWFQRVANSGSEHARYPVQFVRSFIFLGTLHEKRGDMAKAL